ncbi:MAG TPA: type II secretion system protein N [Burkholderiaceae bacterium]|nr:type II secretion system protein N [Burkholderiaceae bacterium]
MIRRPGPSLGTARRGAREVVAGLGRTGWTIALVAGGLSAATVLASQAPASFADVALERVTRGRVRLAEASGTIWNGRGRVVLADVAPVGADDPSSARGATVAGVPIPGSFGWRLSPWPLLVGVLDARIEHDSMRQPVLLTGRAGELRATAGSIQLPAVALDRLGSPWNTIRPTGSLTVAWDGVVLRDGRFDGRATIELAQAASALTPVRPLGAYRIVVVGSGAQAQVTMTTLSGPLRLDGGGTWDAGAGLRFTATATADEAERARLQPLLGLLGRRDGDRTIIKIGA